MADLDTARMLKELLDREEIKEMRARYCWHVVRSDGEKLAALYTPDGMFEVHNGGPPMIFKGREAIAKTITQTPPGTIFPVIHNHTVVITGDDAYGTSVMEAHGPTLKPDRWSGYYHDRLKRVDGRWYFTAWRWFRYYPTFERSGLDMDEKPETGLSAQYKR